MKKTVLWWITEILKWVFFAGFPIALFLWKCTSIGDTEGSTKFILGVSGYIVALIVYIIIKKVLLKNYIIGLNGKIINFTTSLEIETDPVKMTLIEKALAKALIIRESFTVIPIIIIFGLLVTLCKALETDLITLASVIGVLCLSCIAGFICMIIQSANVKSKNR